MIRDKSHTGPGDYHSSDPMKIESGEPEVNQRRFLTLSCIPGISPGGMSSDSHDVNHIA